MTIKVLVLGGTGFLGSAVVTALLSRGAEVCICAAPRLFESDAIPDGISAGDLAKSLRWADVVVNAAGLSNAAESDQSRLNAANAEMPSLVAQLARAAGVRRFVHFSSAAVQGDRPMLDASEDVRPFSAYSRSKALGERSLLQLDWPGVVLYRPQGVHGIGRRTTDSLRRVAASRLASYVEPADRPSPQALVTNVADAAAFLALVPEQPPHIVVHPWEGVTTAGILRQLGGRSPRRIPGWCALPAVSLLRLAGHCNSRVAASARRLQMMWFGQRIEASWLTDVGWTPVSSWDHNVLVAAQ